MAAVAGVVAAGRAAAVMAGVEEAGLGAAGSADAAVVAGLGT